jgi:hypothetical protein
VAVVEGVFCDKDLESNWKFLQESLEAQQLEVQQLEVQQLNGG